MSTPSDEIAPTQRLALLSARLEAHLSQSAFVYLLHLLYLSLLGVTFFWGLQAQLQRPTSPRSARLFFAISRGAARALMFSLMLSIVLAARTLVTRLKQAPPVVALGLDAPFPTLHVATAVATLALAAVHATCGVVAQAIYDGPRKDGVWGFASITAGGVVLVPLMVAVALFGRSAHRRLTASGTADKAAAPSSTQRAAGLTSRVAHAVLAVVCVVVLIIHGVDGGKPIAYRWLAPALLVALIDSFMRYVNSTPFEVPLADVVWSQRPGGAVEMSFPTPRYFSPGQFFCLSLPGGELAPAKIWPVNHPRDTMMRFVFSRDHPLIAALHPYFRNAAPQPIAQPSGVSDSVQAAPPPAAGHLKMSGPFGTGSRYGAPFGHTVLITTESAAIPSFLSITSSIIESDGTPRAENQTEPSSTPTSDDENRSASEDHLAVLRAHVSEILERRFQLQSLKSDVPHRVDVNVDISNKEGQGSSRSTNDEGHGREVNTQDDVGRMERGEIEEYDRPQKKYTKHNTGRKENSDVQTTENRRNSGVQLNDDDVEPVIMDTSTAEFNTKEDIPEVATATALASKAEHSSLTQWRKIGTEIAAAASEGLLHRADDRVTAAFQGRIPDALKRQGDDKTDNGDGNRNGVGARVVAFAEGQGRSLNVGQSISTELQSKIITAVGTAGSVRQIAAKRKEGGIRQAGVQMVVEATQETMQETRKKMSNSLKGALPAKWEERYERWTSVVSNTLSSWRMYLLRVLHSVKVEFVNTLVTIIRYDAMLAGAALASVGQRSETLIKLGAALSAYVTVTVAQGVLLELSVLKKQFFSERGRWIDLCVLLPVSVITLALSLWQARVTAEPNHASHRARHLAVQAAVLLPLKLVLLMYRLHRSIGLRTVVRQRDWEKTAVPQEETVADGAEDRSDSETKPHSVRLVWPSTTGDEWALEEARAHGARGTVQVATFRSSDNEEYSNVIEQALWKVVSEAQSGAQVAVGVVGDASAMRRVSAAARLVEVRSHLLGRLLHASERNLEADFGKELAGVVPELRGGGCHVRLVLRRDSLF